MVAVAIIEGDGIHGLFAGGLKAVDDDKIAVGALEHKWGTFGTVESGGFAEDVGDAKSVGCEDDTSLAEEFVFGFGVGLVGDDLAENGAGGEFRRFEKGIGFREFFGISSF